MTGYLIGCAVAAPVFIVTTLFFAAWVLVLRYRAAGQLVDLLVDQQQDPPVVIAPGCQDRNCVDCLITRWEMQP